VRAGPWRPELFPEGRELFAIHRQLLYWFPIRERYAQLREMPIFATRSEIDHMYQRFVAPHLPWLGGEPLRTSSCLYTNTRGSRFVIDRHPEHEAVLIVSACSGHGFKHSAAIGESVAQLVSGQASEVDLSAFALSRARPER